jgi:dephospho-CoA kinase
MIIGITGRIAAGKETLTGYLREKGFTYLVTRDLLIEELNKRNIPVTRKSMQDLGDELRRKHGAGVLMKMFLEKIDPEKNYIIDSLRNPGEAEFMRENIKGFILIAVDAPQKLRFDRIVKRGKTPDPMTWEKFLEVDNRDFHDEKDELGQQVGKCFEMADFKIMNDGDLERSMKEIEEIWEEIHKKR